jgi:hypothetical protein
MIHKEDPAWVKDYNSLVDLVSNHFNGGGGDTATLYEIEKFLRAYFHPMQSRIKELEEENQAIKEGWKRGTELYAHLRFDDQEFTPYQLALQKIESLEAELERKEAILSEYRNYIKW